VDRYSGVIGGCIVPHPPLLIPSIGGKDRESVRATYVGMEELGKRLGEMEPDTLIMTSPHSPLYRDAFALRVSPDLGGALHPSGSRGYVFPSVTTSNWLRLCLMKQRRLAWLWRP
jgi:MEMO1 family protein